MRGTLLWSAQQSDQIMQQVVFQFAPRLGLPAERLFRALRESIAAYRKAIEGDAEKQRRDRLDPFAVRTETVQAALTELDRGDMRVGTERVRANELLRDE